MKLEIIALFVCAIMGRTRRKKGIHYYERSDYYYDIKNRLVAIASSD